MCVNIYTHTYFDINIFIYCIYILLIDWLTGWKRRWRQHLKIRLLIWPQSKFYKCYLGCLNIRAQQKAQHDILWLLARFYHRWQTGNVQNSFKSHIQIPFQLCRQWQCCIHCWHSKNVILKLTLGIYVKYRRDKFPNCNFLSESDLTKTNNTWFKQV